MKVNSSQNIYDPMRYDASFHLKVPVFLWIVMLYGMRHALFLFPSMRNAIGPAAEMLGDWRLALFDLPALAALIAAASRVADAKSWVRRVWHAGRHLLLFSYVCSSAGFVVLHRHVLGSADDLRFSNAIAMLVVDVAMVVYLWQSELVRDVFADFPVPIDHEIKPSSG